MTEDASAAGAWKAPYLSYETLTNFFEKKIGSHPLPPRIDAHFLDNYAGSVRPLLISTLRTMGMLGEHNEVLEPLRIAAQGPDARKKVIREWAQDFYVEQLDLAEKHGTAQMLWQSFGRHKYSGSTLRKAVVFYLSLSEDVGLPRSAHFKAPKAPPLPGNRRQQPLRSSVAEMETREEVSGTAPPAGRHASTGEERVIPLGEAGTVTINVDVRWLDLPDETFSELRRLIRDLTALGDGHPSAPTEQEV